MNALGNAVAFGFAVFVFAFTAAWFFVFPTIGLLWCMGVLK